VGTAGGLNYTLVLTDFDKLVTLSSTQSTWTVGATVTVPSYSVVAFVTGSHIDFISIGVGTVSFTSSAGVTISSNGAKLKINGQYIGVALINLSKDNWVLIGNLA
jgi:hypothetical protein